MASSEVINQFTVDAKIWELEGFLSEHGILAAEFAFSLDAGEHGVVDYGFVAGFGVPGSAFLEESGGGFAAVLTPFFELFVGGIDEGGDDAVDVFVEEAGEAGKFLGVEGVAMTALVES